MLCVFSVWVWNDLTDRPHRWRVWGGGAQFKKKLLLLCLLWGTKLQRKSAKNGGRGGAENCKKEASERDVLLLSENKKENNLIFAPFSIRQWWSSKWDLLIKSVGHQQTEICSSWYWAQFISRCRPFLEQLWCSFLPNLCYRLSRKTEEFQNAVSRNISSKKSLRAFFSSQMDNILTIRVFVKRRG